MAATELLVATAYAILGPLTDRPILQSAEEITAGMNVERIIMQSRKVLALIQVGHASCVLDISLLLIYFKLTECFSRQVLENKSAFGFNVHVCFTLRFEAV